MNLIICYTSNVGFAMCLAEPEKISRCSSNGFFSAVHCRTNVDAVSKKQCFSFQQPVNNVLREIESQYRQGLQKMFCSEAFKTAHLQRIWFLRGFVQ